MSLPAKHDPDWFRVTLRNTAMGQECNTIQAHMIMCIIIKTIYLKKMYFMMKLKHFGGL